MELLTLDEEKILVWFGCPNLKLTRKRLMAAGFYATDNDFKKSVFELLEKLKSEDCESVYPDMFYEIYAENEARKAARDEYVAALTDMTGFEAEYLLRS